MIDLGHWRLSENIQLPEDFENNLPVGFVYQVFDKDTGKFYIGQKKMIKTETRPPLKRESATSKSNQGNRLEELSKQLQRTKNKYRKIWRRKIRLRDP